ncbi:MAG: hypothetical protein FWG87_07095 [Defluviitaleaceae bacterium]|nr:hypothetical protein [Defluviitaleaceae bacterium]
MKKIAVKKVVIVLLSALVLVVCAGLLLKTALQTREWIRISNLSLEEILDNIDFLSIEDLTDIFYENRELFENIKDELLASEYIPEDGKSLALYFNYDTNQLYTTNDTHGEKFQSVQNAHAHAIEWFMRIRESNDFFSNISYGTNGQGEPVVSFNIMADSLDIEARISYLPAATAYEIFLLQDNWYALVMRSP